MYYDKVTVSFSSGSTMNSPTFTAVSGKVASCTGSGTTLTIVMTVGYIPIAWYTYGQTGAATNIFTSSFGSPIGNTAFVRNSSTSPERQWSIVQVTPSNTGAGSSAGSVEILIVSRSTSL
jgi:hypothetical protein